jgi:hypothetical protein
MMASNARTIVIDLIGKNSASSVIRQVGTDSEQAAAKSAAAFDASTGKISKSFTKLGNLGASFGLPLAAGLGTVGAALDKTSGKGQNFGSTMSRIGGVELLAAGAGLAFVGTSAVHAADDFETSHARLVTAVNDTGANFAAQAGSVSKLDDTFIKLGFTTTDTENALSRLTAATHDVQKAQNLMGLAADLARARNIDLSSAVDLLSKAQQGNYTSLVRLGVIGKDAAKNLHSMGDVVAYLNGKFGGQSAAFAATYAGKIDALKASANKLQVELGTALIPRLESLASGTISAVAGFESFNASTGGAAGKVLAVGAALPVAVFAMEKLGKAGALVGGGFDSAFAGLGRAISGTKAAAASSDELALADARVAASSAARELATARLPGLQAAVNASTITATAAADELTAASLAVAGAENVDAEAAERLALAKKTAGSADAQLAADQRALAASTATSTAGTEASIGRFAALGAALPQIGLALFAAREGAFVFKDSLGKSSAEASALTNELKRLAETGTVSASLAKSYGGNFKDLAQSIEDARGASEGLQGVNKKFLDIFGGAPSDKYSQPVKDLTKSLLDLNKTDPSAAIGAFQNIKAHLIANGQSAEQVDAAFKKLEQTIGGMSGPVDKATQAQTNLSDAQAKYARDILSHRSANVLASDYHAVYVAAGVVAGAQNKVAAATNAGSGALSSIASSATGATTAYGYLAAGAKTAADALAQLNASAFSGLDLGVAADKAATSFNDAVQNLNHPSTGSGGGASGPTPTAAALDQTSKELAVRDARRGVESATSGVIQAETQLAQSRESNSQAQAALIAATQTYRNILHGYSADSQQAKDATEALTRAQIANTDSAIAARDASRSLQQAKNDAPLAKLAVTDAQTKLSQDRSSGADTETLIRDEIALKDAKLAASAVDDNIKKLQDGVTASRLDAKDKTKDLTSAQKDLNTTLHGYPANSQQAKQATDDLRNAQLGARSAADGVTSAMQGLQAAQDNTATSALNLKRAIADLNGLLTKSPSASAGAHLDSYKTRLDNVKSAAKDLATSAYQDTLNATGSIGGALAAEISAIEQVVNTVPALAAQFSPILQKLEAALLKQQIKQLGAAPVPSPSSGISPPGVGPTRHLASGGPILGNDPSGIPILAHPGEYMISAKGVDKYGLHMMEALNVGTLNKQQLPKFESGGPIGTPSVGISFAAPQTIAGQFTATPKDLEKSGKAQIDGYHDGLKKAWDDKIAPFFAASKPSIQAHFADAKSWLATPAQDLTEGFLEATQVGLVPIHDLFTNTLPAQLKAGTRAAVRAAGTGWSAISGTFATPVNATISHVLNPLIGDVNEIAHAVGMKDIAKGLAPVGSFEVGGKIPKTGLALVHEGEGVLPKAAMLKLPSGVFEALKSGESLVKIVQSIASEKSGTGAAKLANGLGNRAASGVVQYLQQLTAVNQPAITAGGGAGIPIADLPTGGDPRVPGHSITEWASDLLQALGEPASGIDLSTMVTWANHESGGYRGPQYNSGGLNNPLNTTQPWPGSTEGGAQGNIRNYRTFADGIAAQAQNLRSPNYGYPEILAGLAAQNQRQTFDAIDRSQFGTKNLESGGPTGKGPASGIPIMAHPGEYVIKASSTAKYGPKAMAALNAGTVDLPKFESGGPIGRPRTLSKVAGTQTVHNTYHIEIKALDGRDAATLVDQAIRDIERVNGVGSAGRR